MYCCLNYSIDYKERQYYPRANTCQISRRVLNLKTLAILMIEVRLPEIRNPGLSVSNWEIMENIKEKSKPVDYQILRVSLSARELIRFEGEFETVRALRKVSLLLNGKSIKISGFPDPLRLRAYQSDDNYPTQVHWEGYFSDRGVTSFDDGKPGERADTVHIKGLPVRWFSSKSSNRKPCTKVYAHNKDQMLIIQFIIHFHIIIGAKPP